MMSQSHSLLITYSWLLNIAGPAGGNESCQATRASARYGEAQGGHMFKVTLGPDLGLNTMWPSSPAIFPHAQQMPTSYALLSGAVLLAGTG